MSHRNSRPLLLGPSPQTPKIHSERPGTSLCPGSRTSPAPMGWFMIMPCHANPWKSVLNQEIKLWSIYVYICIHMCVCVYYRYVVYTIYIYIYMYISYTYIYIYIYVAAWWPSYKFEDPLTTGCWGTLFWDLQYFQSQRWRQKTFHEGFHRMVTYGYHRTSS